MGENLVVRKNNELILPQEKEFIDNGDVNKVFISGIIEDELEFSHETFWQKFYKTRVKVKRLSQEEDYVPLVISSFLVFNFLEESLKGKYVEVEGHFCSRNKQRKDGANHLELFLLATDINIYEAEKDFEEVVNANLIYLDGYICKPTNYRNTPLGKQVTDIMIAVNRPKNISDYIPCIAWGENALYADTLSVGNRIRILGRIQSREYFKRFSPESEEGEIRIAYEISIMKIIKVEETV